MDYIPAGASRSDGPTRDQVKQFFFLFSAPVTKLVAEQQPCCIVLEQKCLKSLELSKILEPKIEFSHLGLVFSFIYTHKLNCLN